ncbi:MAG: TPM domain-containing protein [Lachnospiraceae bacterium]|nr:TPM domain-containing protein [Lachnospiraceae bacterium]
MEQDFKREARKQYFKYFRVWFAGLGCLLLMGAVIIGGKLMKSDTTERTNEDSPQERVYDYADVLTDAEEEKLREYIAECEAEAQIDIVLVTVEEDMESLGYSYDSAMTNYADDFYDYGQFGYDRVHGDGVLLLDNWYEDQEGSCLSTCGSVHDEFGDYEIDRVLDEVYYTVGNNPYKAYRNYVTMVTDYMTSGSVGASIPWWAIVIVPVIAALIFAFTHLKQKAADTTTTSSTYVAGGRPDIKVRRDDFIRKNVVTRRIETSSSSSGSGHRSGGGGSHRSSSGVRHGGGVRRR